MEITETFQSFIRHQKVPCLCKTEEIFPSTKLSTFKAKNIATILNGKTLRFRIGKRNPAEMKWENQCSIRHSCIEDILAWNEITDCNNANEEQTRIQKQIGACCSQHYWCYADYMYMKDLFCDNQEVLPLLDWESLGFHGKDGGDSTMWLGTAGAHTLCHYDSYGYNIVLQVSGSKKWVLFPPSDSEYLYATRIPYEESSVFSEVNVGCPDLQKHPKFNSAEACMVILQPGDMLYVPHHWWHYVENLELSVSINLWYELESDAKSRLDESITRLVVGSCAHVSATSNFPWMNPNEDIESVKSINDNLCYLKQSIDEVAESDFTENDNSLSQQFIVEKELTVLFPNRQNAITVVPLTTKNYVESLAQSTETKFCNKRKNTPIRRIKPLTFRNQENYVRKDLSFTDFVQCLTHKDVIDAVSKVIMNRYEEKVDDDANSDTSPRCGDICSQATEVFARAKAIIDNSSQQHSAVPNGISEPSLAMQVESNNSATIINLTDTIQRDPVITPETPVYKVVIGGSKRRADKLFDIFGYSYTVKRRSAEGKTWICTFRSPGRPSCPAAVYQTGPNEFRPNNKTHIHEGNPASEITSCLMSDIERIIEKNPSSNVRSIAKFKLEEARLKYPHIRLPRIENLVTQIARYRRRHSMIPQKPPTIPKLQLQAFYGITEGETIDTVYQHSMQMAIIKEEIGYESFDKK